MGIKFEMNFLLAAWLIVPAIMFATKIFRMDAKDRHGLDMRMKHHSSFWVKGNILVDGVERVVLQQALEEACLRGITVNDAENAEAHARLRSGASGGRPYNVPSAAKLTSSLGVSAGEVGGAEAPTPIEVQQLTVKGAGGSQFAVQHSLGACEGAEVIASSLHGRRSDATLKALRGASANVLPADSSVLLIPDRVWREAEANFKRIAENKDDTRVSFFN